MRKKILLQETFFIIATIFGLTSCFQNNAIVQEDNDTLTTTEVKEVKVERSWPKDIPSHDHEITSVGIGKFLLYQALDSIAKKEWKFEDIALSGEAHSWEATVYEIDDKEWLRTENYQSQGYITRIFTNSPAFASRDGLKVGALVHEFIADASELETVNLFGEKWYYLHENGIYIKPSGPIHDAAKATIKEIGIICGDC